MNLQNFDKNKKIKKLQLIAKKNLLTGENK